MPSFLDKVKSGAERAAFEADRLRRLNQAKSALRALESDLEQQIGALGQQALALYDAGGLAQPELVASCAPIDTLRQNIKAQVDEVERIQQEKPPSEPVAEPEQSPEAPAPGSEGLQQQAAERAPVGVCPECGAKTGEAKFCPECGAKLA
jgi:membrane protease subunit (stomatin/prohibitin family)